MRNPSTGASVIRVKIVAFVSARMTVSLAFVNRGSRIVYVKMR